MTVNGTISSLVLLNANLSRDNFSSSLPCGRHYCSHHPCFTDRETEVRTFSNLLEAAPKSRGGAGVPALAMASVLLAVPWLVNGSDREEANPGGWPWAGVFKAGACAQVALSYSPRMAVVFQGSGTGDQLSQVGPAPLERSTGKRAWPGQGWCPLQREGPLWSWCFGHARRVRALVESRTRQRSGLAWVPGAA